MNLERWRQGVLARLRLLRWQIGLSHGIVVLTGVTTIILAFQFIFFRNAYEELRPLLLDLATAGSPADVDRTSSAILQAFQSIFLNATLVAALSAVAVSGIASYLLSKLVSQPLEQIVSASQRIADGHYDERVPAPYNEELAQVATHFNQMADSLASVEERRINLIGNVSHELRTPLTAIQGYVEGLQDGLFPASPETFATMGGELARLRRLVNDLQELSRVEAGQIQLQPRRFEVGKLAEQVASQLQPLAAEKGLALRAHRPDKPVFVSADPDRATQILINLLRNAIRYTPAGAVTVTITTTATAACVTVQDTGVGIPPEKLPLLFERFYRVDASRARASGGSGIGLTIARGLAWAMGGDIVAESAGAGQGSAFTFTLPLAPGGAS